MLYIPPKLWNVLACFAPAFSAPTFGRFALLTLSAILTAGARTISNLVRTLQALLPGHASSYHRVFSKRKWSSWSIAHSLVDLILGTFVKDGDVIHLAGDDTVDEHRGAKVYGKGCHRDAVRSSNSHTSFYWGHKWVTLAILVKLPFSKRRWALPVLVGLYRSKKWNDQHGKRHKTPAEIMQSLLAVLVRWYPVRRFRVSLDGGYATHALARFASHHQRQLTLVSRFYSDANLYELPPLKAGSVGRPCKKGKKALTPAQIVARSKAQRMTVTWYGGEKRRVEVVSNVGYWYKGGVGLLPVRWVFVRDLTGTHRDEYFFTTDCRLVPKFIIETYTERWSLEVSYEEARAYVGLGSTRCHSQSSVEREAPFLFGLYSLIVILYSLLPMSEQHHYQLSWVGKQTTTFSDVITTVRRCLWEDWVFETTGQKDAFSKLPKPLREMLLTGLAPAA